MTYEGSVELDNIQDKISRNAIEMQVNEYGQTPKQLFKNPHPRRFSNKISEIFINDQEKVINLNLHDLQELSIEDKIEIEKITLDEDIPNENLQSLKEEYLHLEKEAFYNFDRSYSPFLRFHKK